MYLGRTEAYPYNDVIQADAFPDTSARILAFDPHLKAGDYLYLSGALNQVHYDYDYSGVHRKVKSTLEQKLLLSLAGKFGLKLVEEKNGIAVFQLSAKKLDTH